MPSQDIFQRNLALLHHHGSGEIADRLAALNLSDGLLVQEEGVGLNINLGHAHFYDGGAENFSSKQVQAFLEKPNRFYVQPPMFGSVYLNREEKLYRDVFETFGPISKAQADHLDDRDAGYLLSFGIGLGLHLPKLIAELDVRELVLVEQFWEFLALSLHVQDWGPLYEALEACQGSIHFIVDGDPVALANAAYKALRGRQFGLIDGSFGIQHYRSPVLDKAHELFRDMLPSLAMSQGFFDDECVMFRHARANLSRHEFSIFEDLAADNPLAGRPVFIVGSGPSVDQSIEAIRNNRDNAVVISAGTGLGVLLRAGIKPHIHCETENLPIVYQAVLAHKEGGRDFHGIHLIASPTVDPRIPAEFDDVSFVFRHSLTSSILFSGDHLSLKTGATVANFACRIAVGLGAGRIYLFGVDLGSTSLEKHHSVDSVYLRSKDSFWQSGLGMLPMDQEVPGNLREKVYSNALFMFTRTFFHNLIGQNPQIRFFNSSDGARIEGAIPLPPDLVQLAAQDAVEKAVGKAMAASPHYLAGGYPIPDAVTGYHASVTSWHDSYRSLNRVGFHNFYNELCDLLERKNDIFDEAAQGLMSGTVLLMVQFGYFYLRRLPEHRRRDFLAYFFKALDQQVADMLDEFELMLREG